MLKQLKLLMTIVTLVLLSLFISPIVHANADYVFDRAEVLSDHSEVVISKVVANFEKATGLTLRVGTVTKAENGTLLGSAKDQARAFRHGYYILIGTELK